GQFEMDAPTSEVGLLVVAGATDQVVLVAALDSEGALALVETLVALEPGAASPGTLAEYCEGNNSRILVVGACGVIVRASEPGDRLVAGVSAVDVEKTLVGGAEHQLVIGIRLELDRAEVVQVAAVGWAARPDGERRV